MGEDVADDKRKVSELSMTSTRSHKKINILCISHNIAGTFEASFTTDVTYLPENILLTGPSTLSQMDSSSFYCSTDDSHPAVTLHWSVLEYTESTKEYVSIDADSVETYETALKEGGVQTHSVLTLPPHSSVSTGHVNVTCQAEEDSVLEDSIIVEIPVSKNEEGSGNNESYIAPSSTGYVDSLYDTDGILDYLSGNQDIDNKENSEKSNSDYEINNRSRSGLFKSDSDENESLEMSKEVEEDMVKLVPAGYMEDYEEYDYVLQENNRASRFETKMRNEADDDNKESVDLSSDDKISDATYKRTSIDVTIDSNTTDETFN